MPSVLRRRLYTHRKPPVGSRIDWEHPLSAGLVGFWLLAERSHAPQNLIATAPATSLQGNVSWGTSPQGLSLVFPGASGDYVTTPSYAAMRSSPITVAVYARATNATTGVLANVNYDFTSVPFLLAAGPTSFALQTAFSSYTGATGWVSASASSDYRDGLWHLFVGTYDSAVLRLYIDGVLAGSATQSGLVATSNTNNLDFGRYANDNVYLTGNIGWAALWNRPLPAAAVSRLYAEPYGHLLPPPAHQRWWILVTAGGVSHPVSLSGTQAQSGSVARQVTHPLSGSQAQSGTVTRRVAHSLSGTQAQAGSVTRAVAHRLTGAQAQSGSIVAIKAKIVAVSGTQAQSGSLSHPVLHLLAGTQPQSGSLARPVAHPLVGTQPQAGTVIRRVPRGLTGTQPQAGVVAISAGGKAYTLTGTQAQMGNLTVLMVHYAPSPLPRTTRLGGSATAVHYDGSRLTTRAG